MKLIGKNLYADNGKWLYQESQDGTRTFYSSLTLAKEENKQYYQECTNAEKEEYEKSLYPQVEDAETEPAE